MPTQSTWTNEMLSYLDESYSTRSTKEIAAHTGKSERQVQQKAFERGLKKSKEAKGRATDKWRVLDEIIALIYADMDNTDICEFLGIKRTDLISRACIHGLKKSKKIMREVAKRRTRNFSAKHQFKPGLVPWNKGMRGFDPVLGRGLYRPGNRSPQALPIGTTRVRGASKRGADARLYLEKKIAEPSKWMRVHRLVWEAVHGPVKPGYIVVFKPGTHSLIEEEITLDKLECITRIELAHRNHPMSHSPELAALYQLKSAISRQVNRINKESNNVSPHQ